MLICFTFNKIIRALSLLINFQFLILNFESISNVLIFNNLKIRNSIKIQNSSFKIPPYILLGPGGRQPLCGIGVVSVMETILIPLEAIALTADSLPLPIPFT